MRVLMFSDSDVFAGTERHILDLALGLRGLGVDVCVGCPVPGQLATRAAENSVEILPIAKKGSLDWRSIWKLWRQLRGNRFDLIHAHNGRTAFIATIAITLAGTGRCVYTQHFLEPSYVTRRGIKAAVSKIVHRWVDRRTDHLIANSQATFRGAVARGEATPGGITVIPNGIAPPDRTALRPVASVREELGVEAGVPLVACAARLEPEKDVATLVDAMSLVVQQLPNAVCVITGDGGLRKELQDRVSRLGLDQSVRLLGFRTDVMSIVNASDLFVLPSLVESFGLVVVEAMSLGKPVVAVAAGGPLEIVQVGTTGLLVPPRDAPKMAEAIGLLLTSQETREEMGRRGAAKYRAEFTVERMAQETIAVYERVLGKTAHQSGKVQAASISA